MNTILKGDINITNDINLVREILYSNSPDIKIISLDEGCNLPLDHPNVLGGVCLLPPMDALIAEADGDEQTFDVIYFNHFTEPFVEQFVIALIIFLYYGGHLIMYHPELNSPTGQKLLKMFWNRYGIGIGIVGSTVCTFDGSCVPIWLGYLYMIHSISSYEFLLLYPEDALIPQNIIDELLMDLSPFGDNYQQKIETFVRLRSRLKTNKNIISPIHQII